MSGAAAGAGAANAAAIAQAIRAAGVIVRVEPEEFLRILGRQPGALVVQATGGFFKTTHQYLTSYKGLAFFTKSTFPISLPAGIEQIQAGAIWVPG